MISKECFVGALGNIKKSMDYNAELYKLNTQFGVDGWLFGLDCIEPILSVLSEVFNDKDDWIGYYVFELEMGKKYKDGMVTDKHGNNIDISTPEKLYDFLIIDMQEAD